MTVKPAYIYQAVVIRILDGDTVTLDVDLGFAVHARQSCRVLGINTAELNTASGVTAARLMSDLIPPGSVVTIRSVKPDKYGSRFLADVYLSDGRRLADVLITAGVAVAWDGRGTKPVPDDIRVS